MEITRLADQPIFHPANKEYRGEIIAQSEAAGLFAKPKPQWVVVGLSPTSDKKTATSKMLSEQLREAAVSAGWSVDDACSSELLWCARRMSGEGKIIFMTVSASPEAVLPSAERSSKYAEDAIASAPRLFLRLQYL